MDLRLGDYREVLADVVCDLLCVDAPYSAKTHAGHRDGIGLTGSGTLCNRQDINYAGWSQADVAEFCDFWAQRCRGWIVTVTDHALAPIWADELERTGRYVFAPLPFVAVGSRVRLAGDGPSSWTCWIVVARPKTREFQRWGTLDGAYILPPGYAERGLVTGSKPPWLMRALVRDYSRPGDLVCDPCAGGGTTLLAAAMTGRRAVGAELDPQTHAKAMKRLANTPVTTDLLDTLQAQQMGLL